MQLPVTTSGAWPGICNAIEGVPGLSRCRMRTRNWVSASSAIVNGISGACRFTINEGIVVDGVGSVVVVGSVDVVVRGDDGGEASSANGRATTTTPTSNATTAAASSA